MSMYYLVDTEDKLEGNCIYRNVIDGLTAHQRKQRLFAVVATGGTTNAGIIDDLNGYSINL